MGGGALDETPSGLPLSKTESGLATLDFEKMNPEQIQAYRFAKEMDDRNRPFTDDELDEILPPGYVIVDPPANYVKTRQTISNVSLLMGTPTPIDEPNAFQMAADTPLLQQEQKDLEELHSVIP